MSKDMMDQLHPFALAVALSEINNYDAAMREQICTQAVDAITRLRQLEREAAASAKAIDKLQRQVQFGAQLYRKLTTARLVTHADGGQYIHLGTAHGAGLSRGEPPSEIYRSVDDGRLWKRKQADFAARMSPPSAPAADPAEEARIKALAQTALEQIGAIEPPAPPYPCPTLESCVEWLQYRGELKLEEPKP